MNKTQVDLIMVMVEAAWTKRTNEKLQEVKKMLEDSPHEDGNQRVTVKDDTGKDRTFLVPFEQLIINGLRSDQVIGKYPEVTK